MIKHFLTIAALCFLISNSYGQEVEIPCFTDELLIQKIAENPNILSQRASMENARIELNNSSNKKSVDRCNLKIIPTVFHIIHNNGSENISDSRVNDYIQECNDVWRMKNIALSEIPEEWRDLAADMQVELQLAQIDPDGNPTTGIVRVQSELTSKANDNVKSLSHWPSDKYLNVYIVRTIDLNISGNGTVLGFAYFPWMENSSNSGIVMRSDVLGRNTFPHELGHYLDLYHPFQDACGSTDCQNTGDRVCDTPPTNAANYNCNKNSNTCHQDVPDVRDQIENIMDYSSCRSFFTHGQKERVNSTFAISRSKLVSIENQFATGVLDSNDNIGVPVAEFTSNKTHICVGDKISFLDKSCTISKKSEYKWFFPSGTPSAAFEQNPEVTYNKPGTYDITLIVSNSTGSDTIIKKAYISVIPDVATLKSPYIENFDAPEEFPYTGWTTNSGLSDIKWEKTNSAGKSGNSSLMLSNYDIKNQSGEYTFSLPQVDFTSSKTYMLSFDLAYVKKNDNSNAENLSVYVKDGCDGQEILRFTKSASKLKTGLDNNQSAFKPNDNEWQKFTVDLRAFENSTSLYCKFVFSSNNGNNIYIDNISLGGYPIGIEENNQNKTLDFSVFPNPNNGTFEMNITSETEGTSSIELLNLLGQKIVLKQSQKLAKGNQKIAFTTTKIEPGIYFLIVKTENQIVKHRVVIQ